MSRADVGIPHALKWAIALGAVSLLLVWGALLASSWGSGELVGSGGDVIGPTPLAMMLILGWVPATAGAIVVFVATLWIGARSARGPRFGAGVGMALIVLELLGVVIADQRLHIGEAPGWEQRAALREGADLRSGGVARYLRRHSHTARGLRGVIRTLETSEVRDRLIVGGRLQPKDATALDELTRRMLERQPDNVQARTPFDLVTRDALGHQPFRELALRWPDQQSWLVELAVADEGLARLAAAQGLDPVAEREAIRSTARALVGGPMRQSESALRSLLVLEVSDLRPGSLDGFFEICDLSPRPEERSYCLAWAFREIDYGRRLWGGGAEPMLDSDLAAFERAGDELAGSTESARGRAGLDALQELEKYRFAPGRVTPLLEVSARRDLATGSQQPSRHLFRWLMYEAGGERLRRKERIAAEDLDALEQRAKGLIEASESPFREFGRMLDWVASER